MLWLKLGEFLRCSVGPISESGRAGFVGDAFGVLLMRSGDTYAKVSIERVDVLTAASPTAALVAWTGRGPYAVVTRHCWKGCGAEGRRLTGRTKVMELDGMLLGEIE